MLGQGRIFRDYYLVAMIAVKLADALENLAKSPGVSK